MNSDSETLFKSFSKSQISELTLFKWNILPNIPLLSFIIFSQQPWIGAYFSHSEKWTSWEVSSFGVAYQWFFCVIPRNSCLSLFWTININIVCFERVFQLWWTCQRLKVIKNETSEYKIKTSTPYTIFLYSERMHPAGSFFSKSLIMGSNDITARDLVRGFDWSLFSGWYF